MQRNWRIHCSRGVAVRAGLAGREGGLQGQWQWLTPPARSVGRGRDRRGWPAASVHPEDELRQGLGAGLPAAEHQGDAVLDRDPPAPGAAAAGRGAAHHAHRWPPAPGLTRTGPGPPSRGACAVKYGSVYKPKIYFTSVPLNLLKTGFKNVFAALLLAERIWTCRIWISVVSRTQ